MAKEQTMEITPKELQLRDGGLAERVRQEFGRELLRELLPPPELGVATISVTFIKEIFASRNITLED